MGDADDEVVMVNNSYRSAIVQARGTAVGPAGRLETAFSAAARALEAGAWTGSGGDAFAADLTGHRSTLTAAGPDALQTFDEALDREDPQVPEGAWQTRWHNMRMY